jgi:hypothetical protein
VEGALVEEGASVVGRSFTRQIAEGGYTSELHSCGGVFHSKLTACICSSYGGLESIYGGAPS